jgi:uncharacterized LabA/DUF88 family protein
VFNPTTPRIEDLAKENPGLINNLSELFGAKTNVYIDFANVLHWQDRLEWHIDLKRLNQFLKSFDTLNIVKIYQGYVWNGVNNDDMLTQIKECGYTLVTKPVKVMYLPIDVSGISKSSPDVLKNYLNKDLLKLMDLGTIEYLNTKLAELNRRGIKHIKHLKCNFDVEMGGDIILDAERDSNLKNFCIWSGDSDFSIVVERLKKLNRTVSIFATSKRISRELGASGVPIIDVNKLRKFICWKKEMLL